MLGDDLEMLVERRRRRYIPGSAQQERHQLGEVGDLAADSGRPPSAATTDVEGPPAAPAPGSTRSHVKRGTSPVISTIETSTIIEIQQLLATG